VTPRSTPAPRGSSPSVKPPQRNSRRPAAESHDAASPEPPPARSNAESVKPAPRSASSGPRFPRLSRAVTAAKVALGAAIVIGASAGVAWGAKRYVTTSPRFAVKTITVEGNARLSPQDVAREAGLSVDSNVFAVDLDAAARALEADPWIKTAKVTRKLPGTLVVVVTEHEPAAVVAIDDKLFLASRNGEFFKEASAEDPLDLPVLTGISGAEVARDREGVERSVVRALDVVDEVQKTTLAQRYPVEEVHLEADGTLSLVVGTDGIALHLGRPPFRGKLEQAERVFSELEKRKAQPSIVFLDNDNSPERVVVRMR
jgi:cell division protein FtsQ